MSADSRDSACYRVREAGRGAINRCLRMSDELNMIDDRSEAKFVAEARAMINDLFAVNAAVYWTDFLVTLAIAYPAFYYAHRATLPGPLPLGTG